MTKMAKRSSTMAKAAKNIFKEAGTRLPSKVMMASAKAMSVAMGIPQPAALSVPRFKTVKIKAGTMAPPTAAKMGSAAF